MKRFVILLMVLTLGCNHSKPIKTTPVKIPTIEEKIEVLNTKYGPENLPLVEVEPTGNTPGQNGEQQTWIEVNTPAPYSGVLLNTEGMAYIISEYEARQDRANIAVKKQRDLDLTKLNLETGKLTIELETSEKKNAIIVKGRDDELKRLHELNQKMLEESQKPWTKIIIGVGAALVGVGTGILVGTQTN